MPQDNDLYARITSKIIADLERGELTWCEPWNAGRRVGHVMRPLRWEGTPYSGINTLMLWMKAAEKGYLSPYWMTFKQALDLKAHVRKGEKATITVFANQMIREEEAADGTTTPRTIHYLKQYSVFNASQIEGLPDSFYNRPAPRQLNPEQRVEAFERFFRRTNAEIVTGADPVYNAIRDRIEMPPFERFDDAPAYYATLAHELIHWTGHPSRLSRSFDRKTVGDEGYAKEELVAELGACFLAADLGFEPVVREEHTAYIQSWLKVLKNDTRFIFHAAAHAQRAVEFVMGLQGETAPVPMGDTPSETAETACALKPRLRALD
jgi:antirestriction protein ArdC